MKNLMCLSTRTRVLHMSKGSQSCMKIQRAAPDEVVDSLKVGWQFVEGKDYKM